jgi:hypothetical protein
MRKISNTSIKQRTHFIYEENFKQFYQTKNTLEIAALNMVATFSLKYGLIDDSLRFPNPKAIFQNWYNETFMTLCQGELKTSITFCQYLWVPQNQFRASKIKFLCNNQGFLVPD